MQRPDQGLSDTSALASLRKRVLVAGSWAMGGHLVAQAIRLGGNLVMTRLLVPEMFGLMAIVYVLMIGLALFSDVGLSQSIIQSRRGGDRDFLDTAWIAQIVRGGVIWSIALLLSAILPAIARTQWMPADSVYADPLLPLVIAIYSSTAFISGFESTKLALARRALQQKRIIEIELITQIVSLVAMVAWAAFQRSIWALVLGGVLSALVRVALSHLWVSGPGNRWKWDPSAFEEILAFGKWLFLSSILGFLVINGDRLLLGGLVSAEVLGLYSIGFLIVNSMQVALSQLMASVAFPTFSEVARENPTLLRATYYKFRLPIDIGMLLVAGLLFTLGSSIVRLLYDSRYAGAGPVLEILGIGIVATRYQLVEQCYLALGYSRILTLVNTVRLVFLYLLVPAAFSLYQFTGAVWAIALTPFASLPVIFYFKYKYHLLDTRRELLVLPVLLVGAGIGKLIVLASGS